MGKLATYLQQEFMRRSPTEWEAFYEVPVISRGLESFLGYASRADVVLQRLDGTKRLWIEFEVSRADPVANHAKFATSHLFEPQKPTDIFVSMISSHVLRGRRNLAANTIHLMRRVGMNAFQTTLFPSLCPSEVKRINHLQLDEINYEGLDIEGEIQRALTVTETVISIADQKIHYAGDLMDVLSNLRRWNQDIKTSLGKQKWGKRTITYFVYDPYSRQFAPSKFCAYTALLTEDSALLRLDKTYFRSEMTVDLYVTLDGIDSRFDGQRARIHLTRNLGMVTVVPEESLSKIFSDWLSNHSEVVQIHPRGATILLPPNWF